MSATPYIEQAGSHIASPVLCVGARLGAEVKAFRAAVPGLLSVGTDYNPGNRNPYVMWGDAHSLQFSPNSLAVLYTNVLDHIRNTSTFAREAHRVLRPNGTLWVEMDQNNGAIWSSWTRTTEHSASLLLKWSSWTRKMERIT